MAERIRTFAVVDGREVVFTDRKKRLARRFQEGAGLPRWAVIELRHHPDWNPREVLREVLPKWPLERV